MDKIYCFPGNAGTSFIAENINIDLNNFEKIKEKIKDLEIDIVVVNLYPFKKYLKKNNSYQIIEMIDIGGPSLLRAAGKNFKYITPIIDIIDYKKLVTNLYKNNGSTDIIFRKKMAIKVFKQTAQYDKIISNWLNEN